MKTPLLRINGITKAYPGVIANEDISFDIGKGEVHALLGENGAGKSTLVKILYGLVKPDRGTMALEGAAFAPAKPSAARAMGIAMVFQHFSLFDALNVAQNIALGMENPPKPRDLAAKITQVSAEYGLPLDPHKTVGTLSAGERQRVEIMRCLLQNPQLLIMDEPTSVLTPGEVEVLFATLRQLKDEGRSILYISHKLEEIRALCDTATILRQGRKVDTCTPSEVSTRDLAEMMVGSSFQAPEKTKRDLGNPVFCVKNLSHQAQDLFGTSLKSISFDVKAGEVIGIGGVAGNGQDELLAALSGEMHTAPDVVTLNGTSIGNLGPAKRRALGVLSAPEERLGHAAAPNMSLVENALITGVDRQSLTRWGFLNWPKAAAFAQEVIKRFDVRTPSASTAAGALSGGNLQKFVIGREVLQDPNVLIINQPTWGVDAAAAAAIRQSLLDLAAQGAALVVISQDLDELMEISDQFGALNAGALSALRPTQELSVDEIGLMMGGAQEVQA